MSELIEIHHHQQITSGHQINRPHQKYHQHHQHKDMRSTARCATFNFQWLLLTRHLAILQVFSTASKVFMSLYISSE